MWPFAEVSQAGRGRCLVAARDIAAGETVLSERPALLFVQPEFEAAVCACCLRTAQGAGSLSCEFCQRCRFCSPACAHEAAGEGGAHSPRMCRALQQLGSVGLSVEEQHLGRFVLHAYGVKAAARTSSAEAARFLGLTELAMPAVGPTASHRSLAAALFPVVASAFVAPDGLAPADVSADDIAVLLAKEAANGFCVMASAGNEQRAVRGTAVCLQAARFNHGCFPNVARFDYFDADRQDRTMLHFRAIDPIPARAELLISYFPVTLSRTERRLRLLDEYGFECSCDRCQVEAQSAGGGGAAMAVDSPAGLSDDDDGEQWEQGGDGYSPEYALWFLKNVCPRPGCGGTLAPPSTDADVMECSYCGFMRTDAAFYAELGEETP